MVESVSGTRWKRVLLVALALVVLAWVVWRTRGALTPFLLGSILAYLLAPLITAIERLMPRQGRFGQFARPVAILVAYIVALGALAVAGFYLIPPLVNQTVEFVQELPTYWDDVLREGNSLLALYRDRVPPQVQAQIESNLDALGAQVGAAASAAMMVTFDAVGTIIGFAAGLALLPLWMFYVLKDQQRALQWFYNLWPEAWRGDVRAIVGMLDEVLAAYVRGQLFLGVIIGVVTGLAMWLIGIPQALVLGVLAGVFELIPVLGPWLAFGVAALVTLATERDRLLLVGIAFLAIQQLENTFLVPKIQGDAVRVHPAVIMVLLVIGGSLWGVFGMIVIVPLTAVLRDIFVYLYKRLGETDPA
ncbi:MAG: AI-2E family transporter [Sphaerobacter sp.]|nr:AI-2E family transporter [Sphaerobacter sp.]